MANSRNHLNLPKSNRFMKEVQNRTLQIIALSQSKIVEKHVTKHQFAYLKNMTSYTRLSQDLEKNHSCNTALLGLLDKWLKNIEKGELTGAVFFDLRKAFDAVDHKILL